MEATDKKPETFLVLVLITELGKSFLVYAHTSCNRRLPGIADKVTSVNYGAALQPTC
jgi:hypothetical protein